MAITKYKTKMLQINLPVRGYKEGQQVPIKVDGQDQPADPYWRRRLKDAEIDGCVEIVKTKKKGGK